MKFSVILSNVGSCSDRYMSSGYSEAFDLPQLFERISKVSGITGVEFVGGWNITVDNAHYIKEELLKANLEAVSIIPDHFGRPLWGKGAFTSPSLSTRKEAVKEALDMAKAAEIIGCKTISIWNGQDGFDYPFQADYIKANNYLVEGIRACCDEYPKINFSLEYKPKEPRNHSYISTVYSTLLLVDEIERKNVGVTIDTGHANVAYENIASAAATALRKNKLFHLHINDNYGLWDDDMMTGSIHTIEYLEFFWWIKKLNYNGWMSVDQYPYREDSLMAAQESINWMHTFDKVSDRIDSRRLQTILNNNDAVESTKLIRELIFG